MKTLQWILLLMFLASCTGTVLTAKNYGPFPSPQGEKQKTSLFTVSWAKNIDPQYDSGNLPIALHSPLIYSGIVYAGHNSGYMIAYELENGKELWRQTDNGAYHAAPVIYKDHIIYGTNQGRLYSRHYLTGQLQYEVDLGASVESKVTVFKGRALVHLRNSQIMALDAVTGKILWAYKRSIPMLTTLQRVSRPAVDEKGHVYVGFPDGYVCCFSLEDGSLVWERKLSTASKFIDVDNTPVLVKDRLYIGSLAGPLYVLDSNTGAVIRANDYTASRAPQIKGEKILLGTINGEIVSMDLNLNNLTVKKLSDATISSIVEWKDLLAVATVDGYLYLVDPLNFDVKAERYLGHASSAVFGNMAVEQDKLVLISARNRLYAFK